MAKDQQRRSILDSILGREGAADEIEKQLADVEDTLDNEGVEHKALSLDTIEAWLAKQMLNVQDLRVKQATKADVTADDLVDFVMLAIDQITEAGSEGDPREVVAELVRTVFESAEEPIEEIDVEIEADEERAVDAEDEEDEEEKAQRLDLMATVSDDTAATLKAMLETRDMLAALQDMPSNVEALSEKIAAVEAQLAQRPRASENDNTVLNIGRVKQIVKAAVKAESDEENLVSVLGIPGLLPEVQQE